VINYKRNGKKKKKKKKTISVKMAIELIGFSGSGFTLLVIAVLKELGLSYKFSPPAQFTDIKTPEYLATKHPL
jgi:hypothetical protein